MTRLQSELVKFGHLSCVPSPSYSRLEFLKTLDDLYTDGKIPNVSIVLNDSDFSTGSGYGHHYGYLDGNAGYYDEREEAEAKKRAGWRRWMPF